MAQTWKPERHPFQPATELVAATAHDPKPTSTCPAHPPAVGGAHGSHYDHIASAVVAVAVALAAGARLGGGGGLRRQGWRSEERRPLCWLEGRGVSCNLGLQEHTSLAGRWGRQEGSSSPLPESERRGAPLPPGRAAPSGARRGCCTRPAAWQGCGRGRAGGWGHAVKRSRHRGWTPG